MKNKILSIIILSSLLILCLVPAVSATEAERLLTAEETVRDFLDKDGRIIGISSKGEWDEYPENSIPAIKAAAKTGIDMILIDVKKTADDAFIVFSDDTTERMTSSDTIYTVAETEYSVLSSLFLRSCCGGINAEETEYKIPLLKDVLNTAKEENVALVIRCACADIPEISKILTENNMLSSVILMTEDSAKNIEKALSECTEKPYIAGSIKGNVIFVINSYVNNLGKLSCAGVQLKTGNRYGINYYPSLLSKYSAKMRVIADPTTPEISGFREDSEKWWNDLITRGYSVIVTDHAEMFCEYIGQTDKARERLKKLYNKFVTENKLPDFKDENLNDMKKAYTDAVSYAEKLLGDNSSSVIDLNDCYAKLNKAANDINSNFSALEDGSAGTSVTFPRILLCIAFAVAVVYFQIYFFKKRKKEG